MSDTETVQPADAANLRSVAAYLDWRWRAPRDDGERREMEAAREMLAARLRALADVMEKMPELAEHLKQAHDWVPIQREKASARIEAAQRILAALLSPGA